MCKKAGHITSPVSILSIQTIIYITILLVDNTPDTVFRSGIDSLFLYCFVVTFYQELNLKDGSLERLVEELLFGAVDEADRGNLQRMTEVWLLEGELSPQQFNTWIRPLQAVENHGSIRLYAPNRFVLDWINEQHLEQIMSLGALLERLGMSFV